MNVTDAFSFGASQTGLSDLTVQPLAANGSSLGSPVVGTFHEIGLGVYTWTGAVDDASAFLKAYRTGDATVFCLSVVDRTLTAQQVRDAMKLAPTSGAAATGSVDDLLGRPGSGAGPYAIGPSGGAGAGGAAATLDADNDGSFSSWTASALRFTASGSPVAGLTVRAYTKSAWDAGTGGGLVAESITDDAGDWLVYLSSGDFVITSDAAYDPYMAARATIRVP